MCRQCVDTAPTLSCQRRIVVEMVVAVYSYVAGCLLRNSIRLDVAHSYFEGVAGVFLVLLLTGAVDQPVSSTRRLTGLRAERS